jgi:hypothetical protein
MNEGDVAAAAGGAKGSIAQGEAKAAAAPAAAATSSRWALLALRGLLYGIAWLCIFL